MFIILCLCSKANQYYKDFNGVNRQPSNGLKSKRQPSKKVLFYRQLSKLHNICFKVSHISLIHLIFTDFGLLVENSVSPMFSNTPWFSRHYKTLKLAYIRTFFEILKTTDQENLVQKHKRYIDIIQKINFHWITVNSQNWKKINRQSSKSYHPIEAVISFSLGLGYLVENKVNQLGAKTSARENTKAKICFLRIL